ncbi:hypothetical protein TorRG33x02_044130 [Trema orientale]|uniref:Uncharacterized protein n=1 Tax=Trema orientale TaxID=63057 RepID=A0A2P5FPC6_TREOI|nr:hypothetical protein TorRG33x02_044130 [Trema orientale]
MVIAKHDASCTVTCNRYCYTFGSVDRGEKLSNK